MTRALIAGIAGQDGTYLTELLLDLGYEVFGVARRQLDPRLVGLPRLLSEVRLVPCDLTDQDSITRTIQRIQPDEVYNFAAVTSVGRSWAHPEATADVTGVGVLRILEAIRVASGITASQCASPGQIRFFQASSSEMFGDVSERRQSELTPLLPKSPYGVAKTFGHHITKSYRENYAMHAVSGILFNHESPRRGVEYVTRKVSLGVARIKAGVDSTLRLGNLDDRRDWGYAGDYVRAMHSMVVAKSPSDYVIGTGRTHSVRDLVSAAFGHVGLDWRDHVMSDPTLFRPEMFGQLCADATRANECLGWAAELPFEDLVRQMVEADLTLVAGEQRLLDPRDPHIP